MKRTLSQTHPEIAVQLVDQTLGDVITYGSAKKVDWLCPLGHTWPASPNSRSAMGSGCGVCAGKIVLLGFNDLASQNPTLASELVDPDLAKAVTTKSGKKLQWRCPIGHVWEASVNTRAAGHGCSVCSSKKVVPGFNDVATTHPEAAAKLADPEVGRHVTAFSAKKVMWLCDKGHQWMAPVARVVGGAGCSVCSGMTVLPGINDIATANPVMAAELMDPDMATKITAQSNQPVDWICSLGHTWRVSPNARRKNSQCPTCRNRKVLQGFNDLATTHPEIAVQAIDDVTSVTYGSHRLVTWKCDKGHEWAATPLSRTLAQSGCPTCAAQSFVSKGEQELAEIVRLLVSDLTVKTTVRNLLHRQELDIVVPDLKIAIEFNGLWWHSENYLDDDYHQRKSRATADKGYRLVHIWDDDWKGRRELVVRALAHRLGASANLLAVLPDADPMLAERLFARKLTLGSATSAQARAFWQANHLQGPVGSSHYFSLRDDQNQIRALLGVGNKNHGSRVKAAPGVWDVQRYATAGSVVGGFSKLLKHATEQLRSAGELVTTWTSYSNDDVSDGGMYQAAGFTVDKTQRPSYTYIGALTGWKRAHRTQFVKQRFIDDESLLYTDGWTEHQAARANGLYRIYDAGKTRWVKHL